MTPDYTADEVREALAPIASLLGKSEKAQRNLKPGTWQHTMLAENIRALRLASALMSEDADASRTGTPAELEDAVRAIASMATRTEASQAKFEPGTAQHSLQRNRLKALRIAEAYARAAIDAGRGDATDHTDEG